MFIKHCSVLSMNSQSKLWVGYGLLDHCIFHLYPFVMLIRTTNHSKARNRVQVCWAFRHLKFWTAVIRWNLKTDSKNENNLELLVHLVLFYLVPLWFQPSIQSLWEIRVCGNSSIFSRLRQRFLAFNNSNNHGLHVKEKPKFRPSFWNKVILILTKRCDECFGQVACK
jgi:hypothetical protein